MDEDDAFNFIVGMDEARTDWNFTLRLCDHFDKLRAEHMKEQAEDHEALVMKKLGMTP